MKKALLWGCMLAFPIVLKLSGVVGWSWWVTLGPVWIGLGLFVIIFVIIGLIAAWEAGETQ